MREEAVGYHGIPSGLPMLSTFVTIWLLHVAALLTPGANLLLVTQLAASGHRRSASYAALGVASGAAIWSTAS